MQPSAPNRAKGTGVCAAAFFVLWVAALVLGHRALLAHDDEAGAPATPPASWPEASKIQREKGLPTIVLLAHPKCPCTRASIGELAILMAQGYGHATATVVFIRPDGMPADWEKTDLWASAARIPGVSVMSDAGGVEAARFGAQASGQTLVYDAQGALQFSGGITDFRGHAGDNAGRTAVTSLVLTGHAGIDHTSVFGCSLKNPERAVHP